MLSPWQVPFFNEKKRSSIIAVLGAQWGDEGKGKLVDVLADGADVCCRFNGGANAGHTLVVHGVRYALHLVPCGVLYPHTANLLGNGVVVHLKTLVQELDEVDKHIPKASERVFISSRAHLVFDFHQAVDDCQEMEKNECGSALGTTKRGIGPCYSSKMARVGVRAIDLLNWPVFERKYRTLLADFQKRYSFSHDAEEELQRHRQYLERLGNRIIDGISWLHAKIRAGQRILVEGANATSLDIDLGTYPCVTSSSTIAGGICTGLGIPPAMIEQVIGVVKAYTTRVGEGPFMTELSNSDGDTLRKSGHEFGTTTGRPRRCGWFDAILVRFAATINGFVAVNLTKLDVLTGIKPLKICVAYRCITTGTLLTDIAVPQSVEAHAQFEPVYDEVEGWDEDITHVSKYVDLPVAAQNYVRVVQELISVPVVWIGVGPGREEMICRSATEATN